MSTTWAMQEPHASAPSTSWYRAVNCGQPPGSQDMHCSLPAELEGGQVEVDAAKGGTGKGMQLGFGRSRETAARLPVLGLSFQDQLHVVQVTQMSA